MKLFIFSIVAISIGSCRSAHLGKSSSSSVSSSGLVTSSFTGPLVFLPDHTKTPGFLCTTNDPNFQEYRYPEKIPYCVRNVGMAEKRQVAAAYGVSEADFSQYEFDHFIPLSIGGSDDPRNLFPQRLDAAHEKDGLEMHLYSQMAAGKILQAEAVAQIRAWKPSGL